MHIRSKVMQLWWPPTQCLDIVEGPAEVVQRPFTSRSLAECRKVPEDSAAKT